jgi:hypothetical protein
MRVARPINALAHTPRFAHAPSLSASLPLCLSASLSIYRFSTLSRPSNVLSREWSLSEAATTELDRLEDTGASARGQVTMSGWLKEYDPSAYN